MTEEEKLPDIPCGTETELGIIEEGEENPYSPGHDFVFNLAHPAMEMGEENITWDPEARIAGLSHSEKKHSSREEHTYFRALDWLARGNYLLCNGARFYDDADHPEVSTSLCRNSRQVVICSRACYRWIDDLRKKYREVLGRKYIIFRNNIASRGIDNPIPGLPGPRVSFACHENYAFPRSVPEHILIAKMIPWLIFRTPIIGAGKVGADNDMPWANFQISARADFIECLTGNQTTERRPLYNTRDDPLADEELWRRIHVIIGDSNMLELPDDLKLGLTSILLLMIRDGKMDNRFELLDPLRSFWKVSRDLDLRELYSFRNGPRRTALDCLKEYADLFWNYLDTQQPSNEIYKEVVGYFFEILELLDKRDWEGLFGKLDWVTKRMVIEHSCARRGRGWQSDWATKIDYDYHNNNHQEGLFFTRILPSIKTVQISADEEIKQLRAIRISTDEEIKQAMLEPPPTRSRWLTETRFKFRKQVFSSDFWHKITFTSKKPKELTTLRFNNPYTAWNAELAERLLSLPLPEFLEAVPNAGLDATVGNRARLDFRIGRDYDPDDYEFIELPPPWWL